MRTCLDNDGRPSMCMCMCNVSEMSIAMCIYILKTHVVCSAHAQVVSRSWIGHNNKLLYKS